MGSGRFKGSDDLIGLRHALIRYFIGTGNRAEIGVFHRGAGIAAVVLFAWTSQARQDDAIRRNERNVAVLATRLDSICEKLDDIRTLLADRRRAQGPDRRQP